MRRPAELVLIIGLAAIGGCGIPRDSGPRVLPGGVIDPYLGQPPPGTDAQRPTTPRAVTVPIYLARAEDLVKVTRTAVAPDLRSVLTVLLAGPTGDDLAAGIRSAIAPQTSLRSVSLDGDTATVDLGSAFVDVKGQEQILAVAQIVMTATAVPGVAQVRFLLNGDRVDVPGADGNLNSEPRRAEDYAILLQP